jgi:hypothetical protein
VKRPPEPSNIEIYLSAAFVAALILAVALGGIVNNL